jgi:hypothetical protein
LIQGGGPKNAEAASIEGGSVEIRYTTSRPPVRAATTSNNKGSDDS